MFNFVNVQYCILTRQFCHLSAIYFNDPAYAYKPVHTSKRGAFFEWKTLEICHWQLHKDRFLRLYPYDIKLFSE